MGTYWNQEGKYSTHTIDKVITQSDKLQKAVNCYYDLYNNGLRNYNFDWRHSFPGITIQEARTANPHDEGDIISQKIEKQIDKYIEEML